MPSPTFVTVTTHELREGDVVHAHGLRVLIDAPMRVSKSHPTTPDSPTLYLRALVIERDPESAVPLAWTTEPDGSQRWTIQGNGLAQWYVERDALEERVRKLVAIAAPYALAVDDVVHALIDEDVSSGEYDGGSSELEIAAEQYRPIVVRVLGGEQA